MSVSLGGRVKGNQLRIYVISSFFAALAGSLIAGVDNSIHPDMLYWTTSGEVILMAVLGGIGRFFGPFIGAGVILVIGEVRGSQDRILVADHRSGDDGDGSSLAPRPGRRIPTAQGTYDIRSRGE